MAEHMGQDTKRIKGSTVVVGLLCAMLVVSLCVNGYGMLVIAINDVRDGSARKKVDMIVADLDRMSRAGTLEQYDMSMADVAGKPRMWTGREIDGVKHEMWIVGSENYFVEFYWILSGKEQYEPFAGPVYAAHFVRVGCCAEGEDRWWVMDSDLLEAYVLVE